MGNSATERAYSAIKRQLLTSVLEPGDRIVVEDIGSELGISRTPVREALQALAREGLVKVVPRHGYFVTEISYREALDAYQLRFILEPIATAMAARRINEEEIAHLRELAPVSTDGSDENILHAVERNRAFHIGIAQISGNERLTKIMADLLDDMSRLTYVELRTTRAEADWDEEHAAILDALERRDPMLAARVVRATFQRDAGLMHARAKEELVRLLAEMDSPDSVNADGIHRSDAV